MTEKDETIEIRDHRQPGWFWAQNEVVDVHCLKIGKDGFAVYMLLARFVSNRTQKARIGMRKMAFLLGTGTAQILAALKVLEDEGLIKVERTPGRVSEYALLELKGTVSAADTPSSKVSPERSQASLERIHAVSGADTNQDLSSRLSSKGKAENIWNQAKGELAFQMETLSFDAWLRNSRGVSLDDHVLTVGVRTQAAVEWCTHRLGKIVERTLAEVTGHEVGVKFEVM